MNNEQPNQICIALSYKSAQALYEYLRHEFISYEHYPEVIELVKALRAHFHHE